MWLLFGVFALLLLSIGWLCRKPLAPEGSEPAPPKPEPALPPYDEVAEQRELKGYHPHTCPLWHASPPPSRSLRGPLCSGLVLLLAVLATGCTNYWGLYWDVKPARWGGADDVYPADQPLTPEEVEFVADWIDHLPAVPVGRGRLYHIRWDYAPSGLSGCGAGQTRSGVPESHPFLVVLAPPQPEHLPARDSATWLQCAALTLCAGRWVPQEWQR